jgi:octaprenyl-diphosphate synthase
MIDKLKSNPYTELKDILSDNLKQVDDIIIKLADSHIELIPEIVNHLTQSGGKRIRPLLTLACAKMINCHNPAIVKLAASVEFIHTATLFHDDVIDESDLRRGQQTAKSIWGNKASILVGDFLLSHAFKLMVSSSSLDALSMLASASITITEAEVWQLDLIGKIMDEQDKYIQLILGKTASLFAASCAVAGVLNKSEQFIIDALYEYGLNLGILFQITDDLLDYSAEEKVFGKRIGSDFLEKKMTLPLIVLLNLANEIDKKIIIDNFCSTNPDIGLISTLILKYDIEKNVEIYESIYLERANKALSVLPDNLVRQILSDLLYYITQRKD